MERLKLPFLTVIEGGRLHIRTDESGLGHVVDNAALELLQEPEVTWICGKNILKGEKYFTTKTEDILVSVEQRSAAEEVVHGLGHILVHPDVESGGQYSTVKYS